MRRYLPLVIVLATACSGEAHPPATAATQPAPDSSVASQDAGQAPPLRDGSSPRPLPIASDQALVREVATPLASDQVTLVEPGSSFRVELQGRIDDARLVLSTSTTPWCRSRERSSWRPRPALRWRRASRSALARATLSGSKGPPAARLTTPTGALTFRPPCG